MTKMDELQAKKQLAKQHRQQLLQNLTDFHQKALARSHDPEFAFRATKAYWYKQERADKVQHKTLYRIIWLHFEELLPVQPPVGTPCVLEGV
jgi:hypothetical protein